MAMKRTPMKPVAAQPGGMPSASQNKQMKPKKPKKPLPRFMLIVVTVLVMLLLVGGAGACLYFNVGGLADQAMVLFPEYRVAAAGLEKREADIASLQAKLKADQETLAAGQAALAEQTGALAKREEKLAADKKAFEDGKKTTAAPTAAPEDKRKDIVAIYEALDAADAADMLAKAPTLREAADILSELSVEKAAEIISAIKALDAEKAYDLTKLIGQ